MSERVGFIGLGAIGTPMARHIAGRFETMVWNRTPDRARAFAEACDVSVAQTPGDLVAGTDVVITCLPTSDDVREVVDAASGAWRSGQLLIDATSGDPTASREIAERLGQEGVAFVDAPVSGGTDGAEAGRLTVMLGGDERSVARATEIAVAYAAKISHVGPIGAGHALKAVNNALLAVNIIAAGEGLAALKKLGVEPAVALDVINASSGRSNVTENLIPERVLTRAWPRTFRLALLDKDVGIAVRALAAAGVPATVIPEAKAAYAHARSGLGEEADHVEAIKIIEAAAGVEIA